MSWVGPAIMAGGSLLGGLMGGDSKGGTSQSIPYSTYMMMPQNLQQDWMAASQRMPTTMSMGFGGRSFTMPYGPRFRMDSKLHSPMGSAYSAQPYQPSPLTGALTAAAPYMSQAINNGFLSPLSSGAANYIGGTFNWVNPQFPTSSGGGAYIPNPF